MSGRDSRIMTAPRASLLNAIDPARSYQPAIKLWKPLLAFLLFTLAVTLTGFAVFHSYKQSITSDNQNDLAGIANLKIRQITNWMEEGKGNARALINDPMFLEDVDHWLKQGSPAGKIRAELIEHLRVPQQAYAAYGYVSVSLFDSHGVLRLSSSPHEEPPGVRDRTRLLDSMRSGQIAFSDIHLDQFSSGDRMEIELRAPLIMNRNGRPHTIGAILFRVDPHRFVFPLIQNWPTPSASAENLLVRRDGDDVVFMNELRHLKSRPMTLRFPLSRQELLASKAVMSKTGLAEGIDYRGVPVVGVLSKIPGTSWFMVSKIDKAEIYAPVNRLAKWMLLLMLALVAAGATLTVFWWKREIRQYRGELERRALSTHLDYLAKYANDIILLLDAKGQIIDCNDRAVEAFGYSNEELLHLDIDDLRSADLSISAEERFRRVDEAGGALLFESMMVRRNGEHLPVEVSVRRLYVAGECYYQAILRDITERRKAEETLHFHSEILKNLSQGIMLVSSADGEILFTNAQFERMFGYEAGELLGEYVSVLNAPGEKNPEDVAEEINSELTSKGLWTGDVRNIRKDGIVIWCHAHISEIDHPQFGRVWISLQEDITASKERDLKLAENIGHVRELSRRLVHLKEEEMRRLSGELHDRCSPNLSALKIYFSLLAKSLPSQPDEASSQLLKDVSMLLSDTTEAIREVCAELRPPVLDYAGLWPALENLAQSYKQRTGIAVELDEHVGTERLAQDVEIRLFRLVQEALTNCAKHSQAKTVHISFIRRGEEVVLSICDDGIGFDPDVLGKNGHDVGLGLITMREGIEFVGGKLILNTAPGRGTCIEVDLPL